LFNSDGMHLKIFAINFASFCIKMLSWGFNFPTALEENFFLKLTLSTFIFLIALFGEFMKGRADYTIYFEIGIS